MRVALLIIAALVAIPAHADDAWWGRDKALHLVAGVAIGSGCYGTLYLVSDDSPELRTVFCTTLGQLPGLAKELYDSGQPENHFSGKDLFWTAVGVLGSTLILYLLEVLLRSETPQPPSVLHHATGIAIGGPAPR